MDIDVIAGTRPNLVKISPIIRALEDSDHRHNLNYRFIYTGQHYDKTMSTCFFHDLEIPNPDINLKVGSGTQATQTAKIMVGYESVLEKKKPDLCLVVGDVNSTLACALTAKKCQIPVAHVEAGIRSWDSSMPEETNRIVTDSISDWFYTTGESADKNLLDCGVNKDKIITVGNTMIDSIQWYSSSFKQPSFWNEFHLANKNYIVLTLHRPENVDRPQELKKLMLSIDNAADGKTIVFPVHPRTKQILDSLNLKTNNIRLVQPIGYLEFMYLVEHAAGAITDSGGLSEETTFLHVPCITIRSSTERPETVSVGTNILVGKDHNELAFYQHKMNINDWKPGHIPALWDGQASSRIVSHIATLIS